VRFQFEREELPDPFVASTTRTVLRPGAEEGTGISRGGARGMSEVRSRGRSTVEAGALPPGALDGNRAAECEDELTHDREAEPRASPAPVLIRFALPELFEDRVLLILRDPDPVSATMSAQRSSPRGSARTRIVPWSVNFRALPTRFVKICVSRARRS